MAVAKVYNGSSWVVFVPKTHTGSVWSEKPNYWDGSAWEPLYASEVVTLSGEFITTSVSGAVPSVARLIINPDGTLDKLENGSTTQIDASTDWIIPNGAASSSYQVRFTNLAGTITGAGTTLTEDVWADIDQVHGIRTARPIAQGNGQTGATFDLEIRLGTGATLASASYTLQAERTP